GLRAEPRADRALSTILANAAGAPVLVLAARRADLYERGRAFRARAGMAFLRLVRAQKGEIDPIVAHAGLRPGDTVLDATRGRGGRRGVARVAARAWRTARAAKRFRGPGWWRPAPGDVRRAPEAGDAHVHSQEPPLPLV